MEDMQFSDENKKLCIDDLKIDPEFEHALRPLTEDEFSGLEASIVRFKGKGRDPLDDPIHVWANDGTYIIADGHNRYKILLRNKMDTSNITIHTEWSKKSDVTKWILEHQSNRRNLTPSEQVKAWSLYEKQVAEENAVKTGGRPKKGDEKLTSNLTEVSEDKDRSPETAEIVAKKIGVSKNTYKAMKTVVEKGSPDQIARMDRGGRGNSPSALKKEIDEGIPDGFRKCHGCLKIKPLCEFTKRGNGNYETECKVCRYKRDRKASIEKKAADEKLKITTSDIAPKEYYDTNKVIEWTFEEVFKMVTDISNTFRSGIVDIFEKHKNDVLADAENLDKCMNAVKLAMSGVSTELILIGKGTSHAE